MRVRPASSTESISPSEPEEEDEEDVEWEDFDSDSEAGGGCGTTALVTKRAKGYNNHNSDEDNGNAHINAGHDVPNRRADEETKKRSLGEVGGGGVSARRAKTTTTQQQQLDVARSSMPFTMSIDIDVNINAPLSGLNRDNKTGNIILLDTVKELSHQLRTSFLPMLKVRTTVVDCLLLVISMSFLFLMYFYPFLLVMMTRRGGGTSSKTTVRLSVFSALMNDQEGTAIATTMVWVSSMDVASWPDKGCKHWWSSRKICWIQNVHCFSLLLNLSLAYHCVHAYVM